MECVSWQHSTEFCRRLSVVTGDFYTLPTEAQWEYACRAGTNTPFHFGKTITTELANYDGDFTYADGLYGIYREQTMPVGSFPANAWGLLDMHGNVREWCLDHWYASYQDPPFDGSPWLTKDADESGASRLLRGGSWLFAPVDCRSASRGCDRPDYPFGSVGFRIVCLPQDPSLNP